MAATAWLIEAAGPKYWNGHSLSAASFTSDPGAAVRFARFEDGEAVRCWLLEPLHNLLATREHQWMDKP